jgi:hypothetical protein
MRFFFCYDSDERITARITTLNKESLRMDYAKIPNHAIKISPINRKHILSFQRRSLLQFVLCTVFLLASSWVTMHHPGTPLPDGILFYLGYTGVFAFVFLFWGLLMQVPRHIFLQFEFWKKQYLVTSSLPAVVMKTSAWLLPLAYLLFFYLVYPDLGWHEKAVVSALALALVYVRVKLMQCRFAAQAQYRLENPDPAVLTESPHPKTVGYEALTSKCLGDSNT